jgi:hypothetical protein
MPKNCYQSFGQGRSARINYPLRSGRYKLEELTWTFYSYRETLGLVRDYVTGKSTNTLLGGCVSWDKHVWLKKLPLNIANCLGYDLLPGLLALKMEGAQCVDSEYPAIERECLELLEHLEYTRIVLKKNIKLEYQHMKRGGSLLEPLIKEALVLVQKALAVK